MFHKRLLQLAGTAAASAAVANFIGNWTAPPDLSRAAPPHQHLLRSSSLPHKPTHLRVTFFSGIALAASVSADANDEDSESDAARQVRLRIVPILLEARQRLLEALQSSDSSDGGSADDMAAAAVVDSAVAPLRAALSSARASGQLTTDAELHGISAAAHSRLAADCLASCGSRRCRAAAEWISRAQLQDLILAGWTHQDPPVIETSIRLSNLLLSNGRVEAGLTGLEFAAEEAAAGLAEFEAREAHSLRLAVLVEQMGPGVLGDKDEARKLRSLLTELKDRRALKGIAQSNLAKALLHYTGSSNRPAAEARALTMLRSALEVARLTYPSGQHANIACLLNDIGALLCNMGQFIEAARSLSEALEIADQLQLSGTPPDPGLTCTILCNLGEALTHLREPAAAAQACQRAMKLSRKLDNPGAAGNTDDEDFSGRAHYCMALVERCVKELAAAAGDTEKRDKGAA